MDKFRPGDLVLVDKDLGKCVTESRKEGIYWPPSMNCLCGNFARICHASPMFGYTSIVGFEALDGCYSISTGVLSLVWRMDDEKFDVGQTFGFITNQTYWRTVVPNLSFKTSYSATSKVRSLTQYGNVYGVDGVMYHPATIIPATSASAPAATQGLDDDLLGALWDASHGKRDDCEELLKRYRETYGKDRPGFMA